MIPDGNVLELQALSSGLGGNIVLSSGTMTIPNLGSVNANSLTIKGTGVVTSNGLNTGGLSLNSLTLEQGGAAHGCDSNAVICFCF